MVPLNDFKTTAALCPFKRQPIRRLPGNPSAHPSLYRRKIAMYRCMYPPPVHVAALTEIRGWVSPAVASRSGCICDTTNDAATIRRCRPPCILYGAAMIYTTLLNWMTLKREKGKKALKRQKMHTVFMYINSLKKISLLWCYYNIILRYLISYNVILKFRITFKKMFAIIFLKYFYMYIIHYYFFNIYQIMLQKVLFILDIYL